MRLLIVCFLITTGIIIAANFPAVQARPLDVIPRILFYYGLSAAVALGAVSIFMGELLGKLTGRYDSKIRTKRAPRIAGEKVA